MDTPPADLLPRASLLVERGIEKRLHRGLQLYVSRNAEPVAHVAWGENAPGQPLALDTLLLWMSSGKPITALAILQRIESGKLGGDQPVAEIIPEFAQSGKERITLWHLLTHTAGLKPIVSGWPHADWDEVIARICKASLQVDWTPGRQAGYDPARGWFILGEILQRVDGRPLPRLLREDILEPLGMMDSWLAIPPHLFKAYGSRIGIMYGLKDGELHPTRGHAQEVCERPSPGGSFRGPIRELGLFYEMLLRGGKTASGMQLLKPESVDLMVQRHREGLHDLTFHHKVDFGLGLIVNSNRYGAKSVPYGFGEHASDASFGHGGAQSSIGFADPEHGLVVAAVANGCPGEELHNVRFRRLLTAIYEDLGLSQG